MSSLISQTLSPADFNDIMLAIQTIRTKLPFLLDLTNQQKQELPKMDDGRAPFVIKAINYASTVPAIVPPLVTAAEMQKDMELFGKLTQIRMELDRLTEEVTDTATAAGVDAYTTSLVIYEMAKMGQRLGLPGVDAIVNDLKVLFENQGGATPTPTPEP